MKEIKLTQGQVALVDDEDYEWLSQYTWSAHWDDKLKKYYASTHVKTEDGKFPTRKMHRLIMGNPKGKVVDHGDHDALNNQRYNLRVCTYSDNACNRKVQSNNTSGHAGVHFHTNTGKYQASITLRGKRFYLGLFSSYEEALSCRIAAESEMFGEFSYRPSVAP